MQVMQSFQTLVSLGVGQFAQQVGPSLLMFPSLPILKQQGQNIVASMSNTAGMPNPAGMSNQVGVMGA